MITTSNHIALIKLGIEFALTAMLAFMLANAVHGAIQYALDPQHRVTPLSPGKLYTARFRKLISKWLLLWFVFVLFTLIFDYWAYWNVFHLHRRAFIKIFHTLALFIDILFAAIISAHCVAIFKNNKTLIFTVAFLSGASIVIIDLLFQYYFGISTVMWFTDITIAEMHPKTKIYSPPGHIYFLSIILLFFMHASFHDVKRSLRSSDKN